jgi:hypothetical protein
VVLLQHGHVPTCLLCVRSLCRLPIGAPSLSHMMAVCIPCRESWSLALSVASPAVSLVFMFRAEVEDALPCRNVEVVDDCARHPSPFVFAGMCHPPFGVGKLRSVRVVSILLSGYLHIIGFSGFEIGFGLEKRARISVSSWSASGVTDRVQLACFGV